MRRLASFALAVLFAITASQYAAAQSGTLGVVRPWVAYVEAAGEKLGTISQGSGFVLYPDALVVTAAHIVGKNQRVTVMIPSIGRREGRVLRTNRKADVAIIQVPGISSGGLLVNSLPSDAGDDIWLFGFIVEARQPLISMTKGIISQTYSDYYQIDAAARPGFSGGPATTRGGRVVGMLSFGLRQQESFNFIVPMSVILEEIIPVAAQIPGPPTAIRLPDGSRSWEIVSGERIGPVSLGASLDSVKALIGAPTGEEYSSGYLIAYYERLGLGLFLDESGNFPTVEWISVGIGCIASFCPIALRALPQLYVGPSGIRLGQRIDIVRTRMGEPDNTELNEAGLLVWEYPGILFFSDEGVVLHMLVRR